jgi:hypothetical protein
MDGQVLFSPGSLQGLQGCMWTILRGFNTSQSQSWEVSTPASIGLKWIFSQTRSCSVKMRQDLMVLSKWYWKMRKWPYLSPWASVQTLLWWCQHAESVLVKVCRDTIIATEDRCCQCHMSQQLSQNSSSCVDRVSSAMFNNGQLTSSVEECEVEGCNSNQPSSDYYQKVVKPVCHYSHGITTGMLWHHLDKSPSWTWQENIHHG